MLGAGLSAAEALPAGSFLNGRPARRDAAPGLDDSGQLLAMAPVGVPSGSPRALTRNHRDRLSLCPYGLPTRGASVWADGREPRPADLDGTGRWLWSGHNWAEQSPRSPALDSRPF